MSWIADLKDWFALTAGLAAVAGVWLALRQLRIQTRSARLNVLVEVNRSWKNRKLEALQRIEPARWQSDSAISAQIESLAVAALQQ